MNRSITTKTPIKFDLQASLNKGLSYKPHAGKLKHVYFADRKSVDAVQEAMRVLSIKRFP